MSWNKVKGVTAEYKKIKVGGKTIKILIVRQENASSESRVPGVLWIHGGGLAAALNNYCSDKC